MGSLGTDWQQGAPSQVLAPGVPAPGPDSVPTDPALGSAHLRDQAGQCHSGPQCPRLQGGEIKALLSHEEAGRADARVLTRTVNV